MPAPSSIFIQKGKCKTIRQDRTGSTEEVRICCLCVLARADCTGQPTLVLGRNEGRPGKREEAQEVGANGHVLSAGGRLRSWR